MNLKVAMISDHASPLVDPGGVDSGGQNVYVAQVAKHLAREGWTVDVFARRTDPTQPDVMEWLDGVRVVNVPAGPAVPIPKEQLMPYMAEFSQYVRRFAMREHYDLVHANFWLSGMVALDLRRWLNLPFVVTFHALGKVRLMHQGEADRFPPCRGDIEAQICREAGRIIAECPQDRSDLIHLYAADPAKIVTISCGFDPEALAPMSRSAARAALGLRGGEFVVLNVGRLVPRKGVDTVIEGAALFMRRTKAVCRVVVVGGESPHPDPKLTPELGRLMDLARQEGIQDRVLFTGSRRHLALKHYYCAADVFVSAPWYEPFGITPLEAMACGTPVIGSRVGGIKFSVKEGVTGMLVPPRDPFAICEQLNTFYDNPRLADRMGQAGISRVNRHFTWKQVAWQIGRTYHSIRQSTCVRARGEDASRSLSR